MSGSFYHKLKLFLKSKLFLRILLFIVVVQGFWYAFSFMPSLFDEPNHLGYIEMYSEQLSPFISSQDPAWDVLGETTRNPSYLYYFLMSMPLRLFKLLGFSSFAYTVVLRLIHTAIFAIGIYVFEKALRKMNFSKVVSRLSLLILVLTPSVAILPGAISYDNVSLLFAAFLFLSAAKLLNSRRVTQDQLLLYSLIVLFGSLMKFTFIALAAPVSVFLAFHLIKKKKLKTTRIGEFKSKSSIFLLVMLLIGLVLFIERPVMNIIQYGEITPECPSILDEQRCGQNYTQQRDISALKTKSDDFQPKSPYEFTVIDWIPGMIRSQVWLTPWDAPKSAMLIMYSLSFFSSVFLIILWLHSFIKKRSFVLALWSVVSLSLILLMVNYLSYRRLGQVVATSSRYLLPVEPLFIALALTSIGYSIRRKTHLILFIALIIAFVFVREGGLQTYRNSAPESVYWSAE